MLQPPRFIDLGDFALRAWTTSDVHALAAALRSSDAHLRAFTPWVVDGRMPGQSLLERLVKHAADFTAGTEWVYGLFSADGEVLGGCGLYPRVGPNALEIGYWVAAAHTGRGLATRAAAALTTVAFIDPAIERVEMHVDARNVASARVPARLGFSHVRTMESGGVDLQVWCMTRADFARERRVPVGEYQSIDHPAGALHLSLAPNGGFRLYLALWDPIVGGVAGKRQLTGTWKGELGTLELEAPTRRLSYVMVDERTLVWRSSSLPTFADGITLVAV